MHLIASTHTTHIHSYAELQTHAHIHDKVNSLLRLSIPEKVVWHSLRNPPSTNYATWWSNTYFFSPSWRINMLACRLKKVHSEESQIAFLHIVHSQKRKTLHALRKRHAAVLLWDNNSLLSAHKAHWVHLLLRQERERQSVWAATLSISLVTYHSMSSNNEEHMLWLLIAFPYISVYMHLDF